MALLEVDLYKNIYLQAKNPICVLSPEGKILQVNPVHDSLFADTPCQVVGSSFASCLSHDELPILLNTVAQGELYSQEIELSRKGRKSLHVDISASGIQDETGQLSAVIIISRDQTQRRGE